jgi:cytochrome c biogenesis protein CcdA/thiol-disulfide isomerase/thioredoxin
MFLLVLFAFIAGVVTVLSPCVLPLLPIILSSSDGSGKQRPLGVVVGFILSFTFFTLFLSTIVRLSGLPAESLRFISIFILITFGASLLIPWVQLQLELLFARFSSFAPIGQNRAGFLGGLLVGLSLGLLWTPCVGPILASVISLAITGTVTTQAVFITFAFALGTAIPMFIIMLAGATALKKVPWLVRNTARIQQLFGVLMILTAVAILGNFDRKFQTYVLQTFPKYGAGLTKIEDNQSVKNQLNKLGSAGENATPLIDVVTNRVPAPELIMGGEWFNSEPLNIADLQGKVVLVDFWTYSCINCQRTFPYLKKWWVSYKDSGLVIIGVHSPEFEFEKNPKNVQKAINDFGITYPVMQDNDFATWKAYKNRYWPAKYLIDAKGQIRYTHFGEGGYDETEKKIQELLTEAGANVGAMKIENPEYQIYARTPELYLGYSRLEYLASPERVMTDQKSAYTKPAELDRNTFSYQGNWTVMSEYAAPDAKSSLDLSFEAKEVYIVARPKNGTGKFKVTLDNTQQFLGEDVTNGEVTVASDRLYKVILLDKPGKHLLKLEFLDNNVELYAFTFG